MCFEIYELDPACFLTAPGLAWQVELKNTKGKLDFLTNINMLLMTEKKYQRMNMVPCPLICKIQ